jgi:transcriptional regulator with XRE-family HTH domain
MELLIKDLAKEKGITLNEIAEKVGITQPSISRIVNGRINPTLDTLEKIADSLGVGITELFKREEKGLICPHCGNSIIVEVHKK